MSEKTVEERLSELERRSNGEVDVSGMSPEQLARAKETGAIPVGRGDPNAAMGRGMELMAKMQEGWNAAPLTPEEALQEYATARDEPPALVHFTQRVRLTHPHTYRRVDYGVGWFLVPGVWTPLLSGGYCQTSVAPTELCAALVAWPSAKSA